MYFCRRKSALNFGGHPDRICFGGGLRFPSALVVVDLWLLLLLLLLLLQLLIMMMMMAVFGCSVPRKRDVTEYITQWL